MNAAMSCPVELTFSWGSGSGVGDQLIIRQVSYRFSGGKCSGEKGSGVWELGRAGQEKAFMVRCEGNEGSWAEPEAGLCWACLRSRGTSTTA